MAKPILTQEIVRSLLDYDPETGIFTWRYRDREYFPTDHAQKAWNAKLAGKKAGAMSYYGYIQIAIFGRLFLAHRLAILYVTGSFPNIDIDHVDRDKTNNRFDNLRIVNRSINQQNRVNPRSDNKTKILGVRQTQSGKFYAKIGINGKRHSIGTFNTPEEASAAYLAAKKALHPDAIQALDTAQIS